MRVLFSTSSPAGYMRPPPLGDEQINCGPDWPDESGPDGRVRSLKSSAGEYDLAALAAKLPPEQRPDVVVCLVDASWRNVPRNLAAFDCPRVLLVADTHHQHSPLIGMLRYLASEPFTRAVLLYDRHHAAFFHAAGFTQIHWFPGLTFPHSDAVVQAARRARRERQLAFVGQASTLHTRRARLLAALAERKLPVAARPLRQQEALAHYGASLLGFNASLNGDLNLRVFEILAAGAGLVTDRLAPAAGLPRLFPENRELATYADENELTAVTERLLRHPAEAQALGAAGAAWFDAHLGESKRRAAFAALAFDGVSPAAFDFSPTERSKVFFGGDTDRLLQSAMVYEGVQELHRRQETVRVELAPETPGEVMELFSTLPRLQLTAPGENSPPDLAVFGRAQAETARHARAARLWCHDAAPEDWEMLARKLGPGGFAPQSRVVAVFGRSQPAPAAPAQPAAAAGDGMKQARALLAGGKVKAALDLARAALARDHRCLEALLILGEIALAREGGAIAEKIFRQALLLKPADPAIEILLGETLRAQGRLRDAGECLERARRARPHDPAALLALARLRQAEDRPQLAEAALREAAAQRPASTAAAQELGDFLRRRGRILEGIGWQRRALGCTDKIIPVCEPGRRRVVFVVQHASTWSSLASVYAAFRADPSWETTLVALPYNHPYLPNPADRTAIFSFLAKEGLPFVRGEDFALEPGCADVLFLQNPYDVTRPAGWTAPELLRVVPRLAYVPYAIEIGGTSEDTTHQFNQPVHNLGWAVFARSAAHRALFAQHGRVGNAHVAVTGHPKFDLLCGLAHAEPDPELAAFARGRPVVLWNPQFDIRPDGSGYSTFLTWWKFLPEEFARRPELAFVIRPHPLFFTTLAARGLLTQTQIDEFLARCDAAGNVRIDRSPSYLAVFAAADAMISDGSSFLIEFGATGKPICYLHNARGPLAHLHYELDLDFVRTECAWAESEESIRSFLDTVQRASGPERAARAAAAQRRLAVNPTGAGAAIKQVVETRLDAESGSEHATENFAAEADKSREHEPAAAC
jgi:tetratricopeptide (TPR) repeat protein